MKTNIILPPPSIFEGSRLIILGFGILVFASPLNAALSFYADRTAFNAANPLAIKEDFQDIVNSTTAFTGPLTTLTSVAGLIDVGDIDPMFTISSQSNQLFVAAAGQSSNASTAIGTNIPNSDFLTVNFGAFAAAFAVDIFQNNGGGSQTGGTQSYTVNFFDGAVNVGTATALVPSGGGGFLGVTSTSLFNRVTIQSNSGLYEVIDNVSITVVPEPSAAALGFAGLAIVFARRKR